MVGACCAACRRPALDNREGSVDATLLQLRVELVAAIDSCITGVAGAQAGALSAADVAKRMMRADSAYRGFSGAIARLELERLNQGTGFTTPQL